MSMTDQQPTAETVTAILTAAGFSEHAPGRAGFTAANSSDDGSPVVVRVCDSDGADAVAAEPTGLKLRIAGAIRDGGRYWAWFDTDRVRVCAWDDAPRSR
jgi:hypothetical protein